MVVKDSDNMSGSEGEGNDPEPQQGDESGAGTEEGQVSPTALVWTHHHPSPVELSQMWPGTGMANFAQKMERNTSRLELEKDSLNTVHFGCSSLVQYFLNQHATQSVPRGKAKWNLIAKKKIRRQTYDRGMEYACCGFDGAGMCTPCVAPKLLSDCKVESCWQAYGWFTH